jgi:RecA-family ATPase
MDSRNPAYHRGARAARSECSQMTQRREAAAERELIAALLLDGSAFMRVASIVDEASLVENRHRVIYRAIAGLTGRGEPADAVTVADALERSGELAEAGGREYLANVLEGVATASNVEAYARIVSGDEGVAHAWPAPIDLPAMLSKAPSRPRMIIDDWLPAGYCTLFAAHGGAGKSSVALHLAACIATGRPWFGLHCSMRRVLYLSCEDRADVLHWRLARICAHESLDVPDLVGLHVLDLVGHDAILFRRDPLTGSGVTAAYGALSRVLESTGAEVLFVDGVADTYGASENDRGEIKGFVNALVRRIGTSGAVVLVHHVNKVSATSGAQAEGYSGSTGWHNSARARWYLRPELERTDEGAEPTGNLILELQKSNLGRADQSMRMRWDDGAHLFVAERTARIDREARDDEEQDGIVAALREVAGRGDYVPAATTGRRTAFHVLSAAQTFPETLSGKRNVKRFWRHIEQLRRMRVLTEGSIRRADGHRTVTLELQAATDKGLDESANESVTAHNGFAEAEPSANRRMPTGVIGGARAHKICPECNGNGCDECGEWKP